MEGGNFCSIQRKNNKKISSIFCGTKHIKLQTSRRNYYLVTNSKIAKNQLHEWQWKQEKDPTNNE